MRPCAAVLLVAAAAAPRALAAADAAAADSWWAYKELAEAVDLSKSVDAIREPRC